MTIHKNNGITVKDNGRGIPVGMHEKLQKSALEVVMTVLHAGGKFDKDTYKVSGGLHGVGVSCVNALSIHLKAEVHRDGKIFTQEYSEGIPQTPVKEIGTTDITGTFVTFLPDDTIMTDLVYKYDVLATRLKELSYLNKKLDDNYELIASLENQILNEQADREIAEQVYDKKIEELNSRIESDEQKFAARVADLEAKLNGLREYEEMKDENDRQLEKLLNTLEMERKKFAEATEEMELKTMRERDRLRENMEQQKREWNEKAHEEIDSRLSEETKKTKNQDFCIFVFIKKREKKEH